MSEEKAITDTLSVKKCINFIVLMIDAGLHYGATLLIISMIFYWFSGMDTISLNHLVGIFGGGILAGMVVFIAAMIFKFPINALFNGVQDLKNKTISEIIS